MDTKNSENNFGSKRTSGYIFDPFIINYDTIMALMLGKAKLLYQPIFNSDGFLIKNHLNGIEYNFNTDPEFNKINPHDILSILPEQPSNEFLNNIKNLVNRYCKICNFSINQIVSDYVSIFDNINLKNTTIIYYDNMDDKIYKKNGTIGFLKDIKNDISLLISNNSEKRINTKLISPYIPIYDDFSNPEMYLNDSVLDQYIISELAKFCGLY